MLCDNLQRLTDINYPDTTTVHYSYNELGLRTYQSNNVAQVWYGYDNMNRLVSSTSSVFSACLPGCGATGTVSSVVNYSHDLNGNRTNIVYPGSVAVGYTFDAANRLTHVTDWADNTTAYGYDDLHRKTGVTYPNSTTSTWDWDDASRLTRIRYANATSNFVDRSYTLDSHGNLTAMEINAGLLPQITPQIKRLKQNAADELTSIQTKTNPDVQGWTDKTPAHDAEGNLISDGTLTYAYDYENRLTSVTSASSVVNYLYTGAGTRMASEIIESGSTNTTIYVIDHADPLRRPIAELDGSGTLIRRFIWGRGVVAQVEADGTAHYFHHDGQGSTLALSDASSVTTDTWFYSPYGEIMNRTGTTVTPYQWCGGVGVRRTANGLYFARHRYYHAGLKRWIVRDPIGLEGGANLYAYGLNSPWLYYDPWGLCADGKDFVSYYRNRLTKKAPNDQWSAWNGWNPFHVIGDVLSDPTIDIGQMEEKKYKYNGKIMRADEMGNYAAGELATDLWSPIIAIPSLIAAEAAGQIFDSKGKSLGQRLKDIGGSFKNNAQGIGKQISEDFEVYGDFMLAAGVAG